MEVVNQRSALLSNFEVLTLLRELESDYLARTKTAQRVKKEDEAAGLPRSNAPVEEICENLRTVEVEAIQYLSAEYQPATSQTETGIAQLTRSLSAYELTKAEKLQIVNLAPTQPVELYVIVEELEDRLGDKMEDILSHVRKALPAQTVTMNGVDGEDDRHIKTNGHLHSTNPPLVFVDSNIDIEEKDEWVYDANEDVYDDTGEGAGVEGDLDMDDD